MALLRILLVDDNPGFLAACIAALSAVAEPLTVQCAANGREAVERAKAAPPDLVLMDLNMPVMGGLEATALIKQEADPPCVVILSLHDAEEYHIAAAAAGADGFAAKHDFPQCLLPWLQAESPCAERLSRAPAGLL